MEKNLELSQGEVEPKSNLLTKFKFILFGMGSLLAWNAILTELPLFNAFISELRPYQSIAFLNFLPNITLQFILLKKNNLFKIQNQLIFSLIFSIALLIIIPAALIFLNFNFILYMIIIICLILIMGLINALCTSGFFSFATYFPLEMIIALSTGQGFAAIFLNVVMFIIIPFTNFSDEKQKEIIRAIIFFSVSILILIICLFCLIFSITNDYFKYFLNKKNEGVEIGKITNDKEQSDHNEELTELTDNNVEIDYQMSFIDMFFLLKDINLLCVFIYIITFAVYPTAFENVVLFNLGDYSFNTLLSIYNVFDTLGRYLVSKVQPTKKLTYICCLSRAILIITMLLNDYFSIKKYNEIFTSIFFIINDAFLGLTNGIGTTLCLGIAPTLVNDELKGKAGASVSFFMIVGICLGTAVSYGTREIIGLF